MGDWNCGDGPTRYECMAEDNAEERSCDNCHRGETCPCGGYTWCGFDWKWHYAWESCEKWEPKEVEL